MDASPPFDGHPYDGDVKEGYNPEHGSSPLSLLTFEREVSKKQVSDVQNP
jgi:hypothetical protein